MKLLPNGYTAEVDQCDATAWYESVSTFADANLYQLWQQGAGRERFTDVSRIVVRDGVELVAAAEVRLFRVPFTPFGIAYALWGPLCRRTRESERGIFRLAIQAMRQEYVTRRGMILRVSPRLVAERDDDCLGALSDEGFSPVPDIKRRQSLILDLSPALDDLRKGLDKKWRNCLSKAERAGLTIQSGTTEDLFATFIGIYERMLKRKQFAPSADIQKHLRIQQALPAHLKMRVVIASSGADACAGAIYSALGDTAVYLFGATDETGMRTSASYLVQWEVLKALKDVGIKHYDVNGVDQIANPGTYHFKRGLAGRHGVPVTFLGQFQALDESIANRSLLAVDRLQRSMRIARAKWAQREKDEKVKPVESDAAAESA